MKSMFYIGLLLGFIIPTFAQMKEPDPAIEIPTGPELPVLSEETFNDNSNGWFVGKSDKYECTILNGKYNIKFIPEKETYYFPKLMGLDPNRDFEIKAEITQVSSTDDAGFGVVWGYKDPKNTFSFIACANGNVKISHIVDGVQKSILPWRQFNYSNQNGTPNIFSILRRDKQWYFLLNGQPIHMCEAMNFHGQNLGIEANNMMQIAVDQLTIKQTKEPMNLVSDQLINFEKVAMSSINSLSHEIAPRLSPDGKTLYMVRKAHPGNLSEKDDIWVSFRQPNGSWSAAKNVGSPLNNKGHNMVVSVAPDNNSLMLMNTYNPDGTQLGAGISQSIKDLNGWTLPVNQVVEDYYNTNQYSEVWLAGNQKVLLFAIERSDTYGERDLYVSFLKGDGSWTVPRNVGPDINTFGDEGGPFLASDDKTLYFSSDGWPGFGGKDIFMSKRLDDSWTRWSKPQNLGPSINSKLWEGYYTMSASGDFAVVASNQEGSGSDLFSISLPTSAKPGAVVMVHGKVLNAKTKEPIGASISYEILPAAGEVGTARSNPSTGEYKIVLNYGTSYGFHAKAEGFISVSENMETPPSGEYKEMEKNLLLVPLSIGETIKLNNVFFVQSKPELRPESFPELDRLVEIMQDNPRLVIELAGHTDNAGKKKLNLQLSQRRVVAVMNYLKQKGIAKANMTGKGYGESRPLFPNNTEENRQKNRRVEFKIVKN
jgi:outer membrane protein OmpA-like peptidoglycan-associated protein